MELFHRYSGLKQRMIGERFGGLDEGLVSRERRARQQNVKRQGSGLLSKHKSGIQLVIPFISRQFSQSAHPILHQRKPVQLLA